MEGTIEKKTFTKFIILIPKPQGGKNRCHRKETGLQQRLLPWASSNGTWNFCHNLLGEAHGAPSLLTYGFSFFSPFKGFGGQIFFWGGLKSSENVSTRVWCVRGLARVLKTPSNPENCKKKEKTLDTFSFCAKLWYAPNPGSKEICWARASKFPKKRLACDGASRCGKIAPNNHLAMATARECALGLLPRWGPLPWQDFLFSRLKALSGLWKHSLHLTSAWVHAPELPIIQFSSRSLLGLHPKICKKQIL